MRAQLRYTPAELVPPGETLAEWLEENSMTQKEFARRSGLTPKHINKFVKGTVSVSVEVASAFENVTLVPARYWTQLDANYQSQLLRQEQQLKLADHVGLLKLFPVIAMRKQGLLGKDPSPVATLQSLLQFFGVANPGALEDVWLKPALLRAAAAYEPSEGSLAAWLRMAELEAIKIKTDPFDAAHCAAALAEIRSFSRLPDVEWWKPLHETCASIGIALVIQKELPKTRVNGATRWLSADKAMVALSVRHRRNDIFWFTFFHELCHVLNHSKKETFVDRKGVSDVSLDLEAEADAFAARVLIPAEHAKYLEHLKSKSAVRAFASDLDIHPGIVVGRMQHEGLIGFNKWNDLKVSFQFVDD